MEIFVRPREIEPFEKILFLVIAIALFFYLDRKIISLNCKAVNSPKESFFTLFCIPFSWMIF